MMWSRLRLLAVAGLAACATDGTGAGEVLVVADIVITPPGAGLVAGGTQQLTASPRTSSGIPVPGRTVSWLTSDDRIATVSASGLVTAVALGEVTVAARVDQITAGVLVNVSPKPVATVTVAPPAAEIQTGQSLTLQATALDGQGEPLTDRAITFLSDNATIASVSTTGVVTAIAPGETVIRARAEGKEGVSTIRVTPRPAARLGFSTQPTNATAGQPFGPVRVTVQDEIGTTVTTATNSVTLELADNPEDVTLGGTLTVAAVAGVATFSNLMLTRAKTDYTLRATSGALSPALSSPFAISSGPGAALGITVQPPASAQSGLPLAQAPVVQVLDAHGNRVAQAGLQVTVALASGSGTLSGPVTAATDADGAAAFAGLVIAGGVGTYQLRFTAPNLTPVVSNGIVLASSALAMVTQPSVTATNGTALAQQPVVRITELDGTPLPQGGVPVTVSLTGNGATLSGTTTVNTNASGVASFSGLTITGTVGSFTLGFAAPGLAPITSAPITLGPGAATQIRIAVQPSATAQSGVPLLQQPVIQLEDQSGNAVSQAGVLVTATLSGSGSLANFTAMTDGSGVATFNDLTITGAAGTKTLGFSATGLSGTTSNTITVSAGAATQIAANSSQSQSATVGTAVTAAPSVVVRDGGGNPVSGVSVTFTVSGGAIVPAAPAVILTDAGGLASLTSWTLGTTAGSNIVTATAAGLGDVVFQATGTPGTAAGLTIAQQPSGTATNDVVLARQPVVQVKDAHGNAKPGVAVTVSLGGDGTLDGDNLTVITDGGGLAAFSGLKITGTTGSKTLIFSADGVPDATSDPIDFTGSDASLTLMSGTDATSIQATGDLLAAHLGPIKGQQILHDLVAVSVSDSVAGPKITGPISQQSRPPEST